MSSLRHFSTSSKVGFVNVELTPRRELDERVSNQTVYLILAAIILVVIAITVIAASPDEHPIRFGP